jgi:hypothetical protein
MAEDIIIRIRDAEGNPICRCSFGEQCGVCHPVHVTVTNTALSAAHNAIQNRYYKIKAQEWSNKVGKCALLTGLKLALIEIQRLMIEAEISTSETTER